MMIEEEERFVISLKDSSPFHALSFYLLALSDLMGSHPVFGKFASAIMYCFTGFLNDWLAHGREGGR